MKREAPVSNNYVYEKETREGNREVKKESGLFHFMRKIRLLLEPYLTIPSSQKKKKNKKKKKRNPSETFIT